MKRTITSLFLLFFSTFALTTCYAQKWQWADKIGLELGGNDYGEAIARDNQGNILVTGRVKGNTTFGTGAGAVTIGAYGDRDIYICKYDSLGTFIWAKRYGGLSSDYGLGIGADSSCNIYITGYYTDSAHFGTTNIISAGGQDIFVAKVTASGALSWVRSVGGTGNESGSALVVDKDGNSYITGCFSGSFTFGPSVVTSAGTLDFFLSKYDTNGNCIWAKTAGNTLNDEGKALTINEAGTAVYLCGYYNNSVTFGSTALAGYGGNDVFVARYDTAGTCVWAKRAGSSNHEIAAAIGIDKSENVYVTGNYLSPPNFGTTAAPVIVAASAGMQDSFLAKYNSAGTILWAKKALGGTGVDNTTALTLNKFNNPIVCGFFETTCSFDGISKTVEGGSRDVFVAEYDTIGSIVWLKTYKGIAKSGIYASGHGVITDNTEHTYFTGGFLDTVSFDGITLVASGVSSDVMTGCLSPYVKAAFNASQLTVCKGSSVVFNNSSRGMPVTYQWTFNGGSPASAGTANPAVTYDSTGVFDVQLIVNNGIEADTLLLPGFITVNSLPVVSIGNDTTACTGTTLVLDAGSGFSSYLWQDGSSGNTLGVSASGQYSVNVTNSNACSASDTINVVFDICTSVTELATNGLDAIVFPNPTTDAPSLLISNFDNAIPMSFQLYDMVGKKVFAIDKLQSSKTLLDTGNLQKGVYTYVIRSEAAILKRGKIVIN